MMKRREKINASPFSSCSPPFSSCYGSVSVFLSAVLILPSHVMASAEEQATASTTETTYQIKKGQQYAICRDLIPYLKKSEKVLSSTNSSFFIAKDSKFKAPKWQQETTFEGIKIRMQHRAYVPTVLEGIGGWKKRIENLERALESDFQVNSVTIDFNNDGTLDHILSMSTYSKEVKTRIYVNYPVNKLGNLALEWFSNSRPSRSIGELFLYDGRTFSLQFFTYSQFSEGSHDEISVQEHFDSPMRASGGLFVKQGVCVISTPSLLHNFTRTQGE